MENAGLSVWNWILTSILRFERNFGNINNSLGSKWWNDWCTRVGLGLRHAWWHWIMPACCMAWSLACVEMTLRGWRYLGQLCHLLCWGKWVQSTNVLERKAVLNHKLDKMLLCPAVRLDIQPVCWELSSNQNTNIFISGRTTIIQDH
jgi:hypothetical protein